MRSFAANPHVSFGDVNLSEQPIRGPPHNPGQGGWPTIRYFNASTGLEGGSYTPLTPGPICDELGSEEGMMGYIENYGGVMLCMLEEEDSWVGCDEKSLKYVEKMTGV